MLYYFQKKEATRDAPYYGSIPLQGGTQLRTSEDSGTSFSLIAPDRVYYLRAPSPDEYRAWIDVLRAETLGTVNRIDEEEAPEKLKAKRDFSRHTIRVAATQSGSAPSGDSSSSPLGRSPSSRPSMQAGSAPSGFGDVLGSSPGASIVPPPPRAQVATLGSSPGSMSERRFFEKVGLAPPHSSDSESEVLSEESDSERVSLLKHPQQQVRHQQQQPQLQTKPEEQEPESDCCCTIL
jgi:hypothetical protein